MHAQPQPATLRGTAPRMDLHEVARLRTAAEHARRVVPGPLGEIAARELRAYADMGFRGAADALVPQLARQVLALSREDLAGLDPPDPASRAA